MNEGIQLVRNQENLRDSTSWIFPTSLIENTACIQVPRLRESRREFTQPAFQLYLFLLPLVRLGDGEEDHGELLLGDLAVAVEVAPLHYRLLKVPKVRRVVVLLPVS